MIAGPPSGGRPPLTDAKPLVFTGIHSRVGMWMIVFGVVFSSWLLRPPSWLLRPLGRNPLTDGFDIGMIIVIVSMVLSGLVGIVFILRHRQRLYVDASGFRIRTGRRSRTLSWDQVRGNLAVAVIPLRNLVGFDLKPLRHCGPGPRPRGGPRRPVPPGRARPDRAQGRQGDRFHSPRDCM